MHGRRRENETKGEAGDIYMTGTGGGSFAAAAPPARLPQLLVQRHQLAVETLRLLLALPRGEAGDEGANKAHGLAGHHKLHQHPVVNLAVQKGHLRGRDGTTTGAGAGGGKDKGPRAVVRASERLTRRKLARRGCCCCGADRARARAGGGGDAR